MAMITKKRIKSHILETIIGILMIIFASIAVYITIRALDMERIDPIVPVLAVLMIVILAILAQTVIIIRIYEQGLENNK